MSLASTETVGRWQVVLAVVAMLIGAPLGAMIAVSTARSVVAARGGDAGDGVGFVIPALSGAVAALLLVLIGAAVLLVFRVDRWRCARAARGVVLVPVVAALPVVALLFGGSLLAAAVAVLPVLVTGAVATVVGRWLRVGFAVLVVGVAAGVTVVVVLGPDAVLLLLPHLLLSVGCWVIAAVMLAPAACGRRALPV